jgi:formiminotetrahydrofolate cyclodeaminase
MQVAEGLIDRSLAEFVRALAGPGAVPGSGCAAAALGALGAALASMALTSAGSEGAARTPSVARSLAEAMEELLLDVQRDAEAYRAFLAARASRREVAEALDRSIAAPRAVAVRALAALEILVEAWDDLRPGLASEGLTAAQALLASVEGAAFTAGVNLTGLEDPSARAAGARELAQLRARARALNATVSARAER